MLVFSLLPAWMAAGCDADVARSPSATTVDSGTSVSGASSTDSSPSEGVDERAPFDEAAARERAEEEVADDTYVDAGAVFGCRDDCSGHEAGWRYRADHGYAGANPDSPSFEEGGRAFDEAVDDRVEEMRRDHADAEEE